MRVETSTASIRVDGLTVIHPLDWMSIEEQPHFKGDDLVESPSSLVSMVVVDYYIFMLFSLYDSSSAATSVYFILSIL